MSKPPLQENANFLTRQETIEYALLFKELHLRHLIAEELYKPDCNFNKIRCYISCGFGGSLIINDIVTSAFDHWGDKDLIHRNRTAYETLVQISRNPEEIQKLTRSERIKIVEKINLQDQDHALLHQIEEVLPRFCLHDEKNMVGNLTNPEKEINEYIADHIWMYEKKEPQKNDNPAPAPQASSAQSLGRRRRILPQIPK